MKKPLKVSKSYKVAAGDSTIVSESISPYLTNGKKLHELVQSDSDILQLIKKGVTKKAMDKTMLMAGISLDEMSAILHLSNRTLRRYSDSTILGTEQSERIVELAKLYHYGEVVMGSIEHFKLWMDSTITALGQRKPKEFLDTSIGIKLLTNLLGRIEQGVYS